MLVYRLQSPSRPQTHSPAIVLLHGIGSHEHDLFGLAPYLDPSCYIFSLRAPLPYGMGGYSWFDLAITPQGLQVDARGAAQSRQAVLEFVAEVTQQYGLDPNQIYVMGFSQGAMLSLSLLLHHPQCWAGAVAMSGCLLPELAPENPNPQAFAAKPVLVTHGDRDPVVPILYGEFTHDQLQRWPLALTYRTYAMGHEVNSDSLTDVVQWFTQYLSPSG
ncbi:MAG: alpha/beta fold hydrolase [Synechococcales cyanobacterium]